MRSLGHENPGLRESKLEIQKLRNNLMSAGLQALYVLVEYIIFSKILFGLSKLLPSIFRKFWSFFGKFYYIQTRDCTFKVRICLLLKCRFYERCYVFAKRRFCVFVVVKKVFKGVCQPFSPFP